MTQGEGPRKDVVGLGLVGLMFAGTLSLLCLPAGSRPPAPPPARTGPREGTFTGQDDALARPRVALRPPPEHYPYLPGPEDDDFPADTRRGAAPRGRQVPARPFEGQKTPPCKEPVETPINGGCWVPHLLKPKGGACPEGLYLHELPGEEGACYLPAGKRERTPTSVEE